MKLKYNAARDRLEGGDLESWLFLRLYTKAQGQLTPEEQERIRKKRFLEVTLTVEGKELSILDVLHHIGEQFDRERDEAALKLVESRARKHLAFMSELFDALESHAREAVHQGLIEQHDLDEAHELVEGDGGK